VPLSLDDFHKFGRELPLLLNLKPCGRFLMEDFHHAGGLPAMMKEIKDLLVGDVMTVNGSSLLNNISSAVTRNRDIIRPLAQPLRQNAGITLLRGNICRNGALLKVGWGTGSLMRHKGRAYCFESVEDYKAKVDDPNLDVDEGSVLVIKGCGPKGFPGLPEVSSLPVPRKLLDKGCTDVIRVTDARLAGSVFGTVISMVCPETAVGGSLSVVRTGDQVELNVEEQKLRLCASKEEVLERLKRWRAPVVPDYYNRGYAKLYLDHVLQPDKGADFDFLASKSGLPPIRDNF